MTHEWEGDAAEVATASETGNDNIGIFSSHFHLLLGFETDNGLVE